MSGNAHQRRVKRRAKARADARMAAACAVVVGFAVSAISAVERAIRASQRAHALSPAPGEVVLTSQTAHHLRRLATDPSTETTTMRTVRLPVGVPGDAT